MMLRLSVQQALLALVSDAQQEWKPQRVQRWAQVSMEQLQPASQLAVQPDELQAPTAEPWQQVQSVSAQQQVS
jgi:trans-aconitate methyltransferase